ncbi:RloB family protein [Bernardetia sp. OM2101]|uniref:RloB family protein n=1 Tax=Bernardetia sp. OM2101 TaxID=3344876 RepID=UPI0035D07D11
MARKSNKREFKKGKGKKVWAIIVDGDTEIWYFQMLKHHEKNLSINIKPDLPKKKKLQEQFESVCQNAKDYDKVFWVIDFDTILKEDKQTKKGETSVVEAFKKYRKQLHEDYENVTVLVNNPCLEFWFLLHFEETSKQFSECESVEKLLKKYIPNYQKTQKFFKKSNQDIYKILKSDQEKAIQNAQKLGVWNEENLKAAKCEMYILLELLEIVK